MIPMKLITPVARELVKQHLRSLEGHDRYLRFGHALNDDSINAYVDGAWSGNNEWLGIVEDGKVIAVVHVAIEGENKAELGLSVNSKWRGQKLGQALFERAIVSLKSHNIHDVYMHCLSENAVMKHIARKNEMHVESLHGETDADITLPESTAVDQIQDVLLTQLAVYDNNVRHVRSAWRRALGI